MDLTALFLYRRPLSHRPPLVLKKHMYCSFASKCRALAVGGLGFIQVMFKTPTCVFPTRADSMRLSLLPSSTINPFITTDTLIPQHSHSSVRLLAYLKGFCQSLIKLCFLLRHFRAFVLGYLMCTVYTQIFYCITSYRKL